MNKNRDDELDALLSQTGIAEQRPSPEQIERWKQAVLKEQVMVRLLKPKRPLLWVGQLAAALAVGFFIGKFTSPPRLEQTNLDPIATVQYVFAKTE